jgi:hypothetical protein
MVFNATSKKYFSYIVAVSFTGGRNERKQQPTCRNFLTNLAHNVVSSTPHLSGIRIYNDSGDRY